MQPLTHNLQEKIKIRIKNKLDVSDLIDNVDIRGADLSRAIIKTFKRTDADISNCNFAYAILGDSENRSNIFSIIRCKMHNCNFEGAQFIGQAWVRSCEAQGCNFRNADISRCSYEHSNFKGCTFCGAVIRIGTNEGIGAIFPKEMFADLCRGWSMKLEAKYLDEE